MEGQHSVIKLEKAFMVEKVTSTIRDETFKDFQSNVVLLLNDSQFPYYVRFLCPQKFEFSIIRFHLTNARQDDHNKLIVHLHFPGETISMRFLNNGHLQKFLALVRSCTQNTISVARRTTQGFRRLSEGVDVMLDKLTEDEEALKICLKKQIQNELAKIYRGG